jgi:hypothetical protein
MTTVDISKAENTVAELSGKIKAWHTLDAAERVVMEAGEIVRGIEGNLSAVRKVSEIVIKCYGVPDVHIPGAGLKDADLRGPLLEVLLKKRAEIRALKEAL